MLEYFPLVKNWPESDTALTVFRYAIVRELCRGKRVLEIGAASGEGTALFAEVAKEVVALDHQNIWDDSPAAKMPNVRFVCQDTLSMPAEWSGSFDVVIAMELIEHLDDYSSLQKLVFNVLSENGLFVFSTPNFDIYSNRGDGSRLPFYRQHLREYTAEELKSSFLDCWSDNAIMGLSQISAPKIDTASGDSETLLYFEKIIYKLNLGKNYPQYKIFKGEPLPYSLPLEYCQSFVSVLCKGPLPKLEDIFAGFQESKMPLTSIVKTAFCSCWNILQMRHRLYFNIDVHIENLENIIKDRDRRLLEVNDLKNIIKDRDRRLLEMKGVIDDRERQLCDRVKIAEDLRMELSKTKKALADKNKL